MVHLAREAVQSLRAVQGDQGDSAAFFKGHRQSAGVGHVDGLLRV
jgi:hypothetical protein